MAKKTNLMAVLAVIAGLLVIYNPDFVRWVVGLYLIITGALDLFNK